MALPKLIYFASRGRAELCRLVLHEADVAYEEDSFLGADAFTALKASGRLPFQAVPVWEEPDGFRLAQSLAIACYLAGTNGLYGTSPRENAECDQMLGAFDDVRGELRRLVAVDPSKRADLRAELLTKTLPRWFANLDRLLGANRGGAGHLVGESMTVADLALWYLLELATDNGFGPAFADRPRLGAFARRIGERPRIAAYVASPRRYPLAPLP
jgi:glutathione S-transferase